MAETGLGLEPGTRAGQAVVNRTGPGWDAARGKAEARDRSIHLPMPAPVKEVIDRGEPPPSPSEGELRQILAAALAAEKKAKATRDKVHAAHQRAQAHLEKCKQVLQSFDDLEQQIARQTIDLLREGDGGAELSPALREQIALRVAFAGADAAALQFSNELADAEAKLTQCAQLTNKAMVPLLGITADGFVRDIRGHEAEIARLQAKLLGFDRICSNYDGRMPERVRDLIFTSLHGRVGSPQEFAVWQIAAAKLRNDPMAQVEIAEPAPPPAVPLGASHQLPHVREAIERMAKARAEQQTSAAEPDAA
jgi:hypothetical protein